MKLTRCYSISIDFSASKHFNSLRVFTVSLWKLKTFPLLSCDYFAISSVHLVKVIKPKWQLHIKFKSTSLSHYVKLCWKLKARLHVPSPSPCPSPCPSSFYIMPMETGHLTGRMGSVPILQDDGPFPLA